MKNILIIGSLNMDIVVNMERMPVVGQTVHGNGYWMNAGGKGANQGCAVGKLGGSITMLGCVGADEYGEQLIENLKMSGVNTKYIKKVDETTGTAFIFTDSDAHNSIVTINGANRYCDINLIENNKKLIQDCDYLLMQLETPNDAVYYAIDIAYEYGKTIILNPAPAPINISDSILRKIDFLTPNETELTTISGCQCDSVKEMVRAGEKLIERGVKNVIVTVGELGAIWIHKEGYELVKGKKVNAVDTTAAGDCFNGAFAVELANGGSVYHSIQKANLAASISVTRKGAQMSLPSKEELDKLE
ncbi:ribokinase [Lachnotalea glycerini]|uniref:Ribokinase n=1 Tax=Lachnotalea glycerini TaxID=1763509 RepID=A0A318EKE3_9FIRM|nr:ribokinase [Lachnotalea glycerini]OYO84468.1 ribokinase [Lachnotalea glycerini]PXV86901.1 ribokinase [Lachnotalea glycerini]